MSRIRRRRAAVKLRDELFSNPTTLLVVHYSCESFYDRPDGSSPRVTSIAVRFFATGETKSFSIHQMAERNKVPLDNLSPHYDSLETEVLREFHKFAERHSTFRWVHWNMRDAQYGFEAINHRTRVLGAVPFDIHESRKVDLAKLLKDLYGSEYAPDPRLASLMRLNDVEAPGFLSGVEEAEAFRAGKYVELHYSTLRKVHVIARLLERLEAGALKTQATVKGIYGNYFVAAIEMLRDHWVVTLIGLLATIMGILGVSIL